MKLKILLSVLFISYSCIAAEWSQTSMSILRGHTFELGDNDVTEVTFENASAFKYGDLFMWFEVTDTQQGTDNTNSAAYYGEFSPRLSLGKIFKFQNSDRFIQDVLIANTFEFGRSSSGVSRARLYGIGFDLKIPYAAFFQANFYIKDNPDREGTTFQTTLAYMFPVSFGERLSFQYAAYVDIIHGSEGDGSEYTAPFAHTGQQFLYDLGANWGEKNKFFIGIEYQWWDRKYGIPAPSGPIENVIKYMFKWNF